MPRKAAAAHSHDTTSLTQPTRHSIVRPIEAPIISTRIASTQSAARAPPAAYRRSSVRRMVGRTPRPAVERGLLAVGLDQGLAVGAGLVEPFGQHRVTDLLQVGFQLRTRCDNLQ